MDMKEIKEMKDRVDKSAERVLIESEVNRVCTLKEMDILRRESGDNIKRLFQLL